MIDWKQRCTPGPWRVSAEGFARSGLWSAPTVYATDDELRYVAVCACADELNFHSATDNLANAKLIAEAGTVLHETGMTPCELAEQRDRLLALLKRYRTETPLGHQPHMIAHEVDDLITVCETKSN